jgi:hypothetical protein
MIVVVICGGLGNQMFQYAAARALSLRCNTDLVLNTNLGFKTDKLYFRVFAMDKLNIHYVKRRILSFDFIGGRLIRKISSSIGFHLLVPWYKIVHEDDSLKKELLESPEKYKNSILCGSYISQAYFEDKADQLRDDFSLLDSFKPKAVTRYMDMIEQSDKIVVAIGIRIYQDIKYLKLRESYITEGVEFYRKAIHYYTEKYKDVKFLIFTQGKDWTINNLPLTEMDYEFVETGVDDSTAVYDMLIFSKCDHYILSNSTFYWWGAWLNASKNKEILISSKCPNNDMHVTRLC